MLLTLLGQQLLIVLLRIPIIQQQILAEIYMIDLCVCVHVCVRVCVHMCMCVYVSV